MERRSNYVRLPAHKVDEIHAMALDSPTYRRKDVSHFSWDVASQCTDPVLVRLDGRPLVPVHEGGAYLGDVEKVGAGLIRVADLNVRCRKCEACLRFRRWYWRSRMLAEIETALEGGRRAWFGTLTWSPQEHQDAEMTAIERAYKGGIEWTELDFGEQFRRVSVVLYEDVRTWMKQLRKVPAYEYWDTVRRFMAEVRCPDKWQPPVLDDEGRYRFTKLMWRHRRTIRKLLLEAGPDGLYGYTWPRPKQFRYVSVFEMHTGKSAAGTGENLFRPHLHLILCEDVGRLTKHSMESKWKVLAGHSAFKLIKDGKKSAGYISKYLSKDMSARVYASVIPSAEHVVALRMGSLLEWELAEPPAAP